METSYRFGSSKAGIVLFAAAYLYLICPGKAQPGNPGSSIIPQANGRVVEVLQTPTPSSMPQSPPQNHADYAAVVNILNWQIISTILTLVATFCGFLGSQKLENKRKTLEEDRRYKILLMSAKYEIDFYGPKLALLSEQLGEVFRALQAREPLIVLPSFQLYPSLLETLKNQMISFMRDSKLSQSVAHCHFELSHLRERLLELRERERGGPLVVHEAFIGNVAGIKKLVDSTILAFKQTSEELEKNVNPQKE
jgi:hypothetical protein